VSVDQRSRAIAILCAVAALSGCAALVFETLWFRVAGLVFGNGLWASSIVLASFMAGLAIGNAFAGVLGWRIARPLRVYAALELGIGLVGAVLVWVLPLLTEVLADVFGTLRERPWLLNAVRFPLAFGLMVVPATAMGATLPVLVKAAFGEGRSGGPGFGRLLGLLYGWNTLGAVAGALLGEALLIGALGIRGSALVAAALDAVAAGGALLLARALEPARTAPPARVPRVPLGGRSLRLLLAAFLAGGAFLALEVVWFRFLSLFVYGTSLVFAVLLAVVLAGISGGGLLAARLLRARTRAAPYLPALALLAACGTLLTYAGFEPVLRTLLPPEGGATAAGTPLHVALLSAPLMLPVALLSGMLFTALGDAARELLVEAARTTGLLTLANTVGAALGSLLGGFVLLPWLGVEGSILGLACAYAAVAPLVWMPAPGAGRRVPRLATGLLAGAFALCLVALPRGTMREVYLAHPVRPFASESSRIVAVREGPLQTLVYLRTDRFGRPLSFRLFTDGFSMSGTGTESRRYMKAFVYLPAALHPDLRQALLISYGVGSTAKALTDTPTLERIDVVDTSADILEMSRIIFSDPDEDPLRDPRVRAHVEDARFYLQTTTRRYDLITGEPPPPKYAGVVSLYTREYFELLRERLAEGGMVTYWLPVHSLTPADARAVMKAFCQVFPDCSLWSGSGLDWILLGGRGVQGAVSASHFRGQWQSSDRRPELEALGFERPELLATTFLAGPRRLAAATADAEPLLDDFPHRLSQEPVLPQEAAQSPFFLGLLDAAAARDELAASPVVVERVPAAVRRAALPWFRWQELVNRRLAVGLGHRLGNEELHAVLTETSLRALPLWMLGSGVEEQRLARGLPERRARRADVRATLGIGALADRNYARAAGRLRRARAAGAAAPRLVLLEVFALCMAGDLDEASRLARRLVRQVPATAGNDAPWRWLEETFGLPDPRRPRSKLP